MTGTGFWPATRREPWPWTAPTASAWSSPSGASTCAPSNTEPLVRLNVETRADQGLLAEKTEELLDLVGRAPA